MTNFEKYKGELMKIEGSFAVNKNTRKIAGCDTTDGVKGCIDCKNCLFNDTQDCFESDKIKWLYEEYKPPVLSDDELELIKILGKINGSEYKYIARNGYGVIRLFKTKPRTNKTGNYCGKYTYIDAASGDKILFPNITYEDGLYDIENKCFIKEKGDD